MIHQQRQFPLRLLLTAALVTAQTVSLSFAEGPSENISAGTKAPFSQKDWIRTINNEYRQLLALYKAKLYSDTQKKIEELQWQLAAQDLPAGYRNKMRKRLEALASGMAARQERDRIREQRRQQKEALIVKPGEKSVEEAQSPLENKMAEEQPGAAEDPANRFTESVLAMKEQLARERHFLESEFQTRLAALYKRGVDRFQAQDFGAAAEILREVELLSPGYKETRQYLKKAENKREQKSMPVPGESVSAPFLPERAAIISQALDLMEQNPEEIPPVQGEIQPVGQKEENL